MQPSSQSHGKKGKKHNRGAQAKRNLEADSIVDSGPVELDLAADSSENTEQAPQQEKTIGSIVAQSLAADTQQNVDRVIGKISGYVEQGKRYVSENPREAVGLAVTAGMVSWALLATKPGRFVFEKGAAQFVPQVSSWLVNTFSPKS